MRSRVTLDDHAHGTARIRAANRMLAALPSDGQRRASESSEPAAPQPRFSAFKVPSGALIISGARVREAFDRDGVS